MPTLTLSRKTMANIPTPEKVMIYFDTATVGFGLRCSPNGKRRWVVEYRPGVGGRGTSKKRMVLGDGKVVTIEEAREAARTILSTAQLGGDPAQDKTEERKSITVHDLLAKYLSQHIALKRKAKTLESFTQLQNKHILPEMGSKRVSHLSRQEVARWHREIGVKGEVTANRAVVVLGAAISFGQRFGYLPEDSKNPTKGIELFRESARERYLSEEELARLGETLRLAETIGLPWEPDPDKKVKHAPKKNRNTMIDPYAVAAIRMLLFTGARRGEILNLKWQHVDLVRGLLNLPDSKTGKKVIALGGPAIELLRTIPRIGNSEMVIAGRDANKSRVDLKKPWDRIREHAKLDGLRMHDLRHSFAAVGAGSGLGLHAIGKLLGHANVSTTARYAHLADDPTKRAANIIANSIANSLAGKSGQ
jgi:integrase